MSPSNITSHHLLQEAQTHAHQMETLVEAGRKLSSSLDEGELLHIILQAALQSIPAAQKGSVLLLDESGQRLKVGAAQGYNQTIPLREGLPRGEGYAWQAVESGQPLLVKDIDKIPSREFFRNIPEANALKSSLAAPLIARGRTLGVLCLDNATHKNAFGPDDLQLLTAFAASAAISLENARLFGQTQRRAEELASLMEISVALRGANSPDQIVALIFDHLGQLFGLSHLAYILPDEQAGDFVIHLARGSWEKFVHSHIPGQKSLAATVHSSATYIHWANTEQNTVIGRRELLEPVRNLLGMPLIMPDRVIASLWLGVGRGEPERDFSASDIRLIHSIADIAASAINRIGLFEQTSADARHMAAITALGHALAESSQVEAMYQKLALAVYDLLPDIGGVFISRFDARRKEIACVCAHMDGAFSDPASLPVLPFAPRKGGRQSRAIATRQPLIVNGITQWQSPAPNSPLTLVGGPARTTCAALYAPMIANGQVVGLIQAQSYTPGHFSPTDADLLSLAANTAAVELQNALLLEESRRRAEQLVHINEVGRLLSETLQETEIHRRLAQAALNLVPGSNTVYLSHYHVETKMIEAVYGMQDGEPVDVTTLPQMPLAPRGGGIQSDAIRTRHPFITGDLQKILRKRKTPAIKVGTPGSDTRSSLAVPMLARGNVVGLINLQSYQKNHYTPQDAELLNLVANAAAIAVENARLYAEISAYQSNLLELNQLGRELAATFDLTEMYRAAYRHVARFMECANFAINFFDNENSLLTNVFLVVDGQETRALLQPLNDDPANARARAIASGTPVRINNLSEIIPQAGAISPGDQYLPNSAIYAPLVVEGRATGLLEIKNNSSAAYTEDHCQLLGAIGVSLGLSLESARLFAQTQKRLEQLSALREIDNAISSSVDLRVTLNVLLEQVCNQLQVDAADILLINEDTISLEFSEGVGFYSPAVRNASARLGEGLAGKIVLGEHSVVVANLQEPKNHFTRQKISFAEGFVSYVGIPMPIKGKNVGLLEIFQRSRLTTNPEWLNFAEMLAGQAAIAIENARLFSNLQHSNRELTLAYDATIEGWSQALELRDEDTEGHSRRVTDHALALARALGVRGEQLTHMQRGGLLHDIGKLGIPDSILHKPGPLTPPEMEIMRRHPVLAYEMLSKIPYLAPAIDIPYAHHEKWDGSGYPRGLKGDEIPLAARIFAISDVYDALINDRIYRKALTREEALEYIRAQAGKHFAPHAAELFLRMMKSGQIE